ncbi:hypothetical protein [Aestuariibaculum suncheonense]|uniref:Uncharacterized protein n=1 Tax=Aestuariibaculum suncheonense TaxID=1028745 RepID=A0A8J6UBX8_9FLAO|nr:hypothetical protein [Aestuariibaculum suncheonense]MBD0835847.1 hypothetical protein [Aestuariibaculum suncheonense]
MFKLRLLILPSVYFITLLTQAQSRINQATSVVEGIEYVKPIDWKRFENNSKTSPQQLLMGKILLNTNKYALSTWWETRGFSETQPDGYLNLKGVSEHYIRPVAVEAEALATSLRLGLYDSAVTGISKTEAEAKTLQLIRSLAHTHISNSENGWGRKWQSALWSGYAGFAAWMMWDQLDKQTQLEILVMIYNECEWIMNDKGLPAIKTYRDLKGEIVSPGDTGAEENAWDSLILSVACAMMPEHPSHNQWMNKMIFLNLNALARPSDLESKKRYHGKLLNAWLVGTNINEDGTIVNHHFIHPDYMTSPFEFNPIMFFELAKQPAPKAVTRHLGLVFEAFTVLDFHVGDSITGGVVKFPGGTIFKADSDDIFYPLGTDWGKGRRMNFVSFNSTVAAYVSDRKTREAATKFELKYGQAALDMQNRFDDRRTYLDKNEDNYPSREAWVANKAATAYIIETLKLLGKPKFTNKAYSRNLDQEI